MEAIQMVDLKRQYQKKKPEVDAAIAEVLQSAAFINGPAVKTFASALEDYLDIKHVIPCANGTDALQIALMALGLQPGDEVITPSFTFIATVEVVALLGLKPVFVDVDDRTFTMDPEALKKAITPATKAIIPVHLYGHSAPMHEILAIAGDIPVIEDNAQAIGGHYTFPDGSRKKTGTMGTIGCTSFFPSKNLGCYGDGGALFTDNDALFEKMSMIANHGQKERYYHERVGCNSRLDTVQAAVLNIKLKNLDDYCDARRAAADYYDNAFKDNKWITTPFRAEYCHHVFHQYTLQLDARINRDAVKERLAEQGIPSMIYYPVPCHMQKMFADLGGAAFDLPVTDRLTSCVLSLPVHTEMTTEELAFISGKVNEIVNEMA
jgi:dTDP-4-amino-4,6-dideoxygalactose transaminase